ncbi:MAG: uroporphyrinogen-III C-methyltransferase [Gammaproteobacteria bacterium]
MSDTEQPDPASPKEAVEVPQASADKLAVEPNLRIEPDRRERRPSRGAFGLAIVALVLALIALAGTAVLGWAGYQLRGEQARVAELEGRVSGLDGRIAALDSSAASVGELTRLGARLKDYEQTRSQQAAAVTTALHALAARIAGAGNADHEDEAAALMRLAQVRLTLARDPAGAERALKLADQALAATAEPGLEPVRAELAREIAALTAVPKPDLTGVYVRLNTLADRVDGLPLAGERVAAPQSATAAPGWSWRGIGAAFRQAFSRLVVVWQGPNTRPLLPPREAYFARANLKLTLASAQLALLEHDSVAYGASIARARELLGTWFDGDAPGVRNALVTLNKAAALNPAPPLPRLGGALDQLQALRNASAPQ